MASGYLSRMDSWQTYPANGVQGRRARRARGNAPRDGYCPTIHSSSTTQTMTALFEVDVNDPEIIRTLPSFSWEARPTGALLLRALTQDRPPLSRFLSVKYLLPSGYLSNLQLAHSKSQKWIILQHSCAVGNFRVHILQHRGLELLLGDTRGRQVVPIERCRKVNSCGNGIPSPPHSSKRDIRPEGLWRPTLWFCQCIMIFSSQIQ